jgi:hypothetical protein
MQGLNLCYLETLRPTYSWERGVVSRQEEDTILLGGPGFGTAMSDLIIITIYVQNMLQLFFG